MSHKCGVELWTGFRGSEWGRIAGFCEDANEPWGSIKVISSPVQ